MYNIISFGTKYNNLLASLEHQTIGSTLSTFNKHLKKGSKIFLHCQSTIFGTAEVTSEYFESQTTLWADKIYPNRFKIDNIIIVEQPQKLNDGIINNSFKEHYGAGWPYKYIFSPHPIPDSIAQLILNKLSTSPIANQENYKNVVLSNCKL